MKMTFTREVEMKYEVFMDAVHDYLEYIGYPVYVESFEPEGVAKSLSATLATCYMRKISVRGTAIIIFALTMEKIKNRINIIGQETLH